MADGVRVTVIPGAGFFVPESYAAAVSEGLRRYPVPEAQEVRAAAFAVARDRTIRLKGTSGVGTSGVAAGNGGRSSSDGPAALTTREVAARLGVSQRNVIDLIMRGRLPGAWRDRDGRWFIPESSVTRRLHDISTRAGGFSPAAP